MEKAYFIYQNSKIDDILEKKDIDILYYGDGECEFNFLASLYNSEYIKKISQSSHKCVLVTPHLSQKSIEAFDMFISKVNIDFISYFDEIVINDFWALKLIRSHFSQETKLIFWNYLFNQRKDPLLKYWADKLKDNAVVNINLQLYNKFFIENNIEAIELYNAFGDMVIENLWAVKKYLYYPYITYATTRHCYRSLIASETKSLKIVDVCSGCKWKEHISFTQDVTEDLQIYNAGNKYFYYNDLENNFSSVDRIIYNNDIIQS